MNKSKTVSIIKIPGRRNTKEEYISVMYFSLSKIEKQWVDKYPVSARIIYNHKRHVTEKQYNKNQVI